MTDDASLRHEFRVSAGTSSVTTCMVVTDTCLGEARNVKTSKINLTLTVDLENQGHTYVPVGIVICFYSKSMKSCFVEIFVFLSNLLIWS